MGEPERFFFVHLQKTGGTALSQRIRQSFGPDVVYPLPEDRDNVASVLSVDHLTDRIRAHRDEVRVISGHFPYCMVDVLDLPLRTFTILRDPVERTLSLLRRRSQRGDARFLGRPLEEIYEDAELQPIIRNHMVKMLSLTVAETETVPLTQAVVFDDARLERAKENLRRIDVVGVQEHFDEFCAELEARFGWDLGEPRFANRTERRPVSDQLRQRIADDNAMDAELYRFAQALIEPRLRARAAGAAPVAAESAPAADERAPAKIVITGTGRAGTTLLVQVLDSLGLDTGLTDGRLSPYAPRVRAGLESRIDAPDAPEVVKDMTLGFRMRVILEAGAVPIRHVLLPERAIDVAAASRIRASSYGRKPFAKGGLTGTRRATHQVAVLRRMRREITSALDDFGIPYTSLEFPRFATDAVYTQAALQAVVPDVTVEAVQRALDQCVREEMIHEAPLSLRERWRTRLTTTWMVLYRYPVSAIRRRLDPEGQQARIRASVAATRQQEAALAERERQAGRLPVSSRDRPTALP